MNRSINEKKIQDVGQKIAAAFHPDKIILYGSWAWGTPDSDSDVDFFIVKETDNTRQLAREIDGFIFPRPFPIDIIVCKPIELKKREQTGDMFVTEILRKGKVLYAS